MKPPSLRALLFMLLLPSTAWGQTLLDASYDPASDAIVVEIAYQGTHPDHTFTLAWDACTKVGGGRQAISARLIDNEGNDLARQEFVVRRRLDLAGLDCRPAEVTLRLGPVSNRTVFVPERVGAR